MIQNFSTDVRVDYDGKDGKAKINWLVEFETREWGIRSANVIVPDQDIEIVLDETADIAHVKLTDVIVELDAPWSTALAPTDLEFYKGKFTAVF
jgi:hypothetical protein